MTLPNLNTMYAELNQRLFNDELPTLPVKWNGRLSSSMGRTHYKRKSKNARWECTLIDIRVGLTPQHLHKTMVHEMCHVWAIHKYQSRGHSHIFWKKMKECGYPDGHSFEEGKGIECDKWQLVKPRSFILRQRVFFDDKDGVTYEGRVVRVNKRTLTIQTYKPEKGKWRVSPTALRTTL